MYIKRTDLGKQLDILGGGLGKEKMVSWVTGRIVAALMTIGNSDRGGLGGQSRNLVSDMLGFLWPT